MPAGCADGEVSPSGDRGPNPPRPTSMGGGTMIGGATMMTLGFGDWPGNGWSGGVSGGGTAVCAPAGPLAIELDSSTAAATRGRLRMIALWNMKPPRLG